MSADASIALGRIRDSETPRGEAIDFEGPVAGSLEQYKFGLRGSARGSPAAAQGSRADNGARVALSRGDHPPRPPPPSELQQLVPCFRPREPKSRPAPGRSSPSMPEATTVPQTAQIAGREKRYYPAVVPAFVKAKQ